MANFNNPSGPETKIEKWMAKNLLGREIIQVGKEHLIYCSTVQS